MEDDIVMRYRALEARLILVEGRECDKNDYLIATFCGAIAGLIDSFLVGKPNLKSTTDNSVLGREADKIADKAVEQFARLNIQKDNRTYDLIRQTLEGENLPKRELNRRLREELVNHGIPENFSREGGYSGLRGNNSLLVYLENKFRVSYDQSTSSRFPDGIDFTLTPNNHHLKSLAHWPDLIGLLISILDQFTGTTTFISDGRIIRAKPGGSLPELRGRTFFEKIFFGFVNWFGHLMSDFCGSHSSKGRGDGLPIPFFGLFLACDFGNFPYGAKDGGGLTIAQLAEKVYEQGYDARFGLAMSIPVVLQDLMIRFIWSVKARFVLGRAWKDCIPTEQHKDLRMMLLVGNAALCAVDAGDALIRSRMEPMEFLLHLNLIGWYKLGKRSLKEVCIRFDFTYEDLKTQYEYLNHQLELYLEQLKSVDYDGYAEKLTALHEIESYIECDDWDTAVLQMDRYIRENGIRSDAADKEDFRNKLTEDGFTFTIGKKD